MTGPVNQPRDDAMLTRGFLASTRLRLEAVLTRLAVYLRIAVLVLLRRPYKLTLLVTDGCNLRCQMCSIWARKRAYISVEEVRNIWSTFTLKPCWINISGGEPFLNRQLPDLLRFFAELERSLLITITTNGQLDVGSVLTPFLSSARKCVLFVSVSTDGNELLHDRIRGRQGAFALATETIAQLRALAECYPALGVGISFTISRINLGHALEFMNRQMRHLPVSINLTQTSPYYGNDSSDAFTELPRRELIRVLKLIQYLQPKLSLEAILKINYLEQTIRFLSGNPSRGRCVSIASNVFITTQLDLVDCSLKFKPWGSGSGTRAEKLLRLTADIRNHAERHRTLMRRVHRDRCEHSCLTPCENYVQLVADLVCPWRAPRLIRCYLARSLESLLIGRKRLHQALAEFEPDSGRLPVTLPVVACESAKP